MMDINLPDGFIQMLDPEDWDEVFESGGWLNRRHIEKIWRKAGRADLPPVDKIELLTARGTNIMKAMEGSWPPA